MHSHCLKRFYPILLSLALAAWMPLQAADDPIPAVDGIFADFDHAESPGCALGVIRDSEFIYRRGYGMANLEHGVPIDSRSVFRIGSTSKQFTAAAVALLAREGRISLEDTLDRHFPEFPEWAREVMVRQLILHSSGIRDYLQLAWLSGQGGDADHYTADWVLNLLARQRETNFPPGSDYLYSNSGYLLLALLVERASGQTLSEYARQKIFGPLGMTDSHFHDDHTHIVPRRAAGYAPQEGGFRISMTTLDLVGDGGVYTTIDDLLLWDRNFYDNRLGGGEEFIEELTTPGRLNDGEALDYAFGLTIGDFRGLPMISHGGAFVGFRAQMLRFPEEALSVAVLCNRSDGAPDRKARQVAEHFLADKLPPASDEAADKGQEAITLSPGELEFYVGDFWEQELAFAAETALDEGKLWAVHAPGRRNELQPLGDHKFRMLGVGADVLVEFEVEGGQVKRVTRLINGQPRGEFKPFERRRATADELAGYAGNYFSEELQAWYQLYLSGDRLMFRAPLQAPQELTAMFGETFENPDYGAFVFQRDPTTGIHGFVLQSGRVRNLAFQRRPD